ncbi:MAG: glycosyltransferase [Phycicoccus sp.]
MRVAILSDCYPPRLGGIESQVHDLARHLDAAGHHVEVFTATAAPHGADGGARGDGGDRGAGADGVVVHRLALPLPGGVPVNPFAAPEVRRRLRRGRFDVAHAHLGVVSPFATDLVRVAVDEGLPVVATFHCVLDRSVPVFRAAGHLARWAGRGVALDAVSRMAAARVSAAAGGAPVEVLGNGIDVAWWREVDTEPRRRVVPVASIGAARAASDERTRATGVGEPAGGGVHVVVATRLASRKRPLATLAVLRRARELLDPAVPLRATVVGDGPQRPVLERYVRSHDLDWVALPGRVGRAELRALHHTADLYLSTARLEAFGIAALEAHVAGVPVVARRGTGIEDFVTDGVDGLLADTDAGLSSAVAELAADDTRRRTLRRHLLAASTRHGWPAVVRATLAEYRRAGAPAP